MAYASAIYGPMMLRVFGYENKEPLTGLIDCFQELVGPHSSMVVLNEKIEIYRPVYSIMLDNKKKSIVVTLRGTMFLEDTLTDLVCDSENFVFDIDGKKFKGSVHKGFLQCHR
eukprot:UN15654